MKDTTAFSTAFTTRALVLGLGLFAFCAQAQESKITPAQAAKKKGYVLKGEGLADLDGNSRKDPFGVCQDDKGLRLCVFSENEKGAYLKKEGPLTGGKIFKSVKAIDLVKSRAGDEVVVEVYDETPDEKVKRVRIYVTGKTIRDVFTSVIYRNKNRSERAAWERDDVVKYGDARQGWYFEDTDADGNQEVLLRRKARIVKIKTKEGSVPILMGVKEAIFAWSGDAESGRFSESGKRMNDFVPPLEVKNIKASSTFVPKDILKDLKAEKMSAAASAAADGEVVPDTEIDRTPWLKTVSDKDLDTAWVEDAKGSGKDEWVELELAEKSTIHMIRIVPGCVSTRREFKRHNTPDRIEFVFDGGERTLVNLRKIKSPDKPAVAAALNPIKDKKYAKQALVFFDGELESKKIKVRLEGVKKRGSKNRACISEISVH